MTPTFHRLTIKDIKKETEDTVSISFNVPSDLVNTFQYTSGQYLTLKEMIGGEDIRRAYSLCSAPFENEWRVAIKQIENGKFSTYANNDLKVGMELDVMNPTGNFVVNTESSNKKSYVFFAAGSGITPILSMMKSILHNESNSEVTLVYGNKNSNSIIFNDEIKSLENQYSSLSVINVFSRENQENEILNGRIDKDRAGKIYDAFLKDTNINSIHMCGPEEMIHGVKESMLEKGISENDIHFELFTVPIKKESTSTEQTSDNPNVESNVTVIVDEEETGFQLNTDGLSVLDAAEEEGADVPFACKGGVCCTCKAKIIEGTASMDANYSLEPYEVEDGYILTCQAHPTSEKLIVSFDE